MFVSEPFFIIYCILNGYIDLIRTSFNATHESKPGRLHYIQVNVERRMLEKKKNSTHQNIK